MRIQKTKQTVTTNVATNQRKLNLRAIVSDIHQNGYTWADIEAIYGYHRTTIQRKLKGTPDPNKPHHLLNGYYTTEQGYQRLLAQVKANTTAKKATLAEQPPLSQSVPKHLVTKKALPEKQRNPNISKFAVVEPGFLYVLANDNRTINDLFKEYQVIYMPETCIAELERASKRPQLKNMAINLLQEIQKFGPEFVVIDSNNCTTLLDYPTNFRYPIRDRSVAVVGALCHIWTENTLPNATFTLLTASREIRKLACRQNFPTDVQIRFHEPIYIK